MTTTANYIIKAVVGGETYLFQYEHCYDAWAALEQFWHEDYPETIINLPDCGTFPIDILSMLEGKVIATMPVTFNCAVFDHFFDKGWSASSQEPNQRYTLDQFAKDIAREPDTASALLPLQTLQRLPEILDGWQQQLSENRQRIDQLTAIIATDWPKEDALKKLRADLAMLDRRINKSIHSDEQQQLAKAA